MIRLNWKAMTANLTIRAMSFKGLACLNCLKMKRINNNGGWKNSLFYKISKSSNDTLFHQCSILNDFHHENLLTTTAVLIWRYPISTFEPMNLQCLLALLCIALQEVTAPTLPAICIVYHQQYDPTATTNAKKDSCMCLLSWICCSNSTWLSCDDCCFW